MAAAANTPHCHRPWQLGVPARASASASRRTSPPVAAAGVGAGGAPNAWTGRLPPPAARRAVGTKAGAAEARPSSPPDAVTYSASISTDTPPPRTSRGLLRRVPPGPRARVPRHVPRREQEPAGRRRGMAGPDAAAAVPPPHRAPRRRHAAAAPRRRARPPSHGVGAEGAGRQLRPLQLRPRRDRVAVRRPEPEPRVPDEGPSGDRHHLRLAAAPAPRARDRPARRRRIGSVEAGGEDEAGRGRWPRRRLQEVSPGEGGSVQGHADAGRDGIGQRPSL